MKEPSLPSDSGSLFARTRNTQKRVWVSMVSREKSVRRLPFCEVPQSPAHRLDYLCTGEKVQIWLPFQKCKVFSQPPFPRLKRRVIKLRFYVGRQKSAIEIMS